MCIGSNGHSKVQWNIRSSIDPFDKRNVQWPSDFSIGHLAWVLDINRFLGGILGGNFGGFWGAFWRAFWGPFLARQRKKAQKPKKPKKAPKSPKASYSGLV